MKNYYSLLTMVFLSFGHVVWGQEPNLTIAEDHIRSLQEKLEFSDDDVRNVIITDSFTSNKSGVANYYFKQQYQGIEVENATMNIHIAKDRSVLHSRTSFIQNLKLKVKGGNVVSPEAAVKKAAEHLGLLTLEVKQKSKEGNKYQFSDAGIARQPIKASSVYYAFDQEVQLVWKVEIFTKDQNHYWVILINANSGEIIKKYDQVLKCEFGTPETPSCSVPHHIENKQIHKQISSISNVGMANSYTAYPLGIESPNHGGRVVLSNPANATASPYGWHDTNGLAGPEYTITRGNNVLASEDIDFNDVPGFSPDGGASLDFNFPLNLNVPPANSDLAARITNLFVWNNFMHDVWYQYGFDEVSGNFQQNNYNRGGYENDYVQADAQDGSGTNNAYFLTLSEGFVSFMTMFLWNWTDPNVFYDSSLDNGIIAHEYGHGISIRLTGGASNVGCLINNEQQGEGWSDWFGLVMSHQPTDTKNTARGIGTYSMGQQTTGAGLRPYKYTHDMTVNPLTYGDLGTQIIPHGTGSVWCTMIWDLYWDLIDQYGYDPDLYHGTGGNNIAMNLVVEGMKYQGCEPGFVDARDGILAADQALYGGANICTIWATFARRGLGYSASQGLSSSTTDGTEAFDLPPSTGAGVRITKSADKTAASPGEVISFTVVVESNCGSASDISVFDQLSNGLEYVAGSASNGGTESGGTITWPNIPILGSGGNSTYTYQAKVSTTPIPEPDLSDDMENGEGNWITYNSPTGSTSNWELQAAPCGSTGWYAEELEAGANNVVYQFLSLNPIVINGNTTLTFDHYFDTEVNWDGGFVEIYSPGDLNTTNLGTYMTSGGYNGYYANNPSAVGFSGASNGCMTTTVDLSSFDCQEVVIRFVFYYDAFAVGDPNNGIADGWYIDNILIDTEAALFNKATATTGGVSYSDKVCLELLPPADLMLTVMASMEGPYDPIANKMRNDLNYYNLLPFIDPYTALGWQVGGVGAFTSQSVFDNYPVVDWVLVELRDKDNPSTVIVTRAGLLKEDGFVTGTDGFSPLSFGSVPPDSYYIAIRHRNHLGLMTATNYGLNPGVNNFINFNTLPLHGNTPAKILPNGDQAMWSGDANHSGVCDAGDRSEAWNSRNSNAYLFTDINLDGTCDAADRSKIWNNRNKSQQLP